MNILDSFNSIHWCARALACSLSGTVVLTYITNYISRNKTQGFRRLPTLCTAGSIGPSYLVFVVGFLGSAGLLCRLNILLYEHVNDDCSQVCLIFTSYTIDTYILHLLSTYMFIIVHLTRIIMP